MLFDIRQFEHFFKESALKKGLRLFEKGELELIERLPGFEYHFAAGDEDIYLKKKGDKLLSYSCSCAGGLYCEHLSAVLFYFQQEALAVSVKTQKFKTGKTPKNARDPKQDLEKAERESLLRFIKSHHNKLSVTLIRSFLSDKSGIGLYDVYSIQMELAVSPYLNSKKLDQEAIESLKQSIAAIFKKQVKETSKENEIFYLSLAVVRAFLPLFHMRFSGNEKPVFELYEEALENLDKAFIKGLTMKEKTAWFNLTLFSVDTNKNLQSEAFMFLVPSCLSFVKNESQLFVLSATLKKRVFKTSYAYQLNKLLIARMEVALCMRKLFKTAVPLPQQESEVEIIIAKAELYFFAGSSDKAFTLLESNYEQVKMGHKNYYKDYLAYMVLNAQKHKKKDIEIKYLRERFIHNLFIIPEDLERFLLLLPEKQHFQALKELAEHIKTREKAYYFDKLSLLLLRGNMLDDLSRELMKVHNKFNLIHEVALKKFPEYTLPFLTLYMRHLAETLKQDSVYNYQLQVFNTAKIFLDKLPEKIVTGLIKKLLDQIGKTGHLYRYINEAYDYPFLKEETNY